MTTHVANGSRSAFQRRNPCGDDSSPESHSGNSNTTRITFTASLTL